MSKARDIVRDTVLIPVQNYPNKGPDTDRIRDWNQKYNDSDFTSWKVMIKGEAPSLEHILEHGVQGEYAVYPKGSRCVVVDVDVPKAGDSDRKGERGSTRAFSIKEAEGMLEELFGIVPYAAYETRSGGIHLYYDCAPEVYPMLKDRETFSIRNHGDGAVMAGDILLGNYAIVHIPLEDFAQGFREDSIPFDVECAAKVLKARERRKEREREKGNVERKGEGKKIRNVESSIQECLDAFGDNPAFVSKYDAWNTIVYCACVAGSEYVNGEWRLNETVRGSIEKWNQGCADKINEDDVPRIWGENQNFDVSYRNACLNGLRKEAGISTPKESRSAAEGITNELIDEAVALVEGRFRFVCINPDSNTWRWFAYEAENTIWRRDDSKDGTSVREYIQSVAENDALSESIMLPKGRGILRCVEERSVMQSHIQAFDPNPHLLNMPGQEVYDTESNRFLPGTPEMLLTRCTSVAVSEEYLMQSDDREGDWEKFVQEIMLPANKDIPECAARCEALQHLEGHMLCGHSTRAFQIQIGSGANGKSTYNRIIEKALGSYAGSVGQGPIVSGPNMQLNPNSIGDALIPLQGKMRSVIPEAKGGISSMLKLLTGESSVSASAKYQAVQDVQITTSIVLTCNELPELSEVEPYRDRVYVIPFEQEFRENPNQNLVKEFSTIERQRQVLRWIINGRKNKPEGQPGKPESWKVSTEGYLSRSDTAGAFVSEMVELDRESVLTWGEIREEAERYYADAGKQNKMRGLSNAEFGKVRARIRSQFAGMKEAKFTKRNAQGIRIVDTVQGAARKSSRVFAKQSEDVRESLDTVQEAVQKVDPDPQSFEELFGIETGAERAAQEAEELEMFAGI